MWDIINRSITSWLVVCRGGIMSARDIVYSSFATVNPIGANCEKDTGNAKSVMNLSIPENGNVYIVIENHTSRSANTTVRQLVQKLLLWTETRAALARMWMNNGQLLVVYFGYVFVNICVGVYTYIWIYTTIRTVYILYTHSCKHRICLLSSIVMSTQRIWLMHCKCETCLTFHLDPVITNTFLDVNEHFLPFKSTSSSCLRFLLSSSPSPFILYQYSLAEVEVISPVNRAWDMTVWDCAEHTWYSDLFIAVFSLSGWFGDLVFGESTLISSYWSPSHFVTHKLYASRVGNRCNFWLTILMSPIRILPEMHDQRTTPERYSFTSRGQDQISHLTHIPCRKYYRQTGWHKSRLGKSTFCMVRNYRVWRMLSWSIHVCTSVRVPSTVDTARGLRESEIEDWCWVACMAFEPVPLLGCLFWLSLYVLLLYCMEARQDKRASTRVD